MTEILTESFCERCGTRYTFESARPRARLKGVKVLSRGLKNFVLSDETSMDEAMAAARSDTDREQTSHQLDAFHKTFNFCMSCRQYTCPNCWNEAEARCLSCAPHLGHEVMPTPFPDLPSGPFDLGPDVAVNGANGLNGSNGAAHPVELIGAAEIEATRRDEEIDAAARLAALTVAAATEVAGAPDPEVAAPAGEAAQPLEAAAAVSEPATASTAPAETEVTDVAFAAALVTDVEPPADTGLDDTAAATTTDENPDAGIAARLAGFGVAAAGLRAVQPDENAPDPFADTGAAVRPSFLRGFKTGEESEQEAAAGPAAGSSAAGPIVTAKPAAAVAPPAEPAAEATEPPLPPIPYQTQVKDVASEPVAASAEPVAVEDALGATADAVASEPEPNAVAPEVIAAAAMVAAAADEPATIAPEPVAAAAAPEEPVTTEPVAAAPEPVAEPVVAEPEPVAAAPEPVAEPVVAEPEPAAEPATPAQVGGDVVSQPVWQRVAPDPGDAPTAAPGLAAAASASPNAEPQWPANPQWPSGKAAAGLPFLGRPAAPQGGLEALWAESSREVATPTNQSRPAGVIQPCVSCGLSLSATARFCRRCGTPQAG